MRKTLHYSTAIIAFLLLGGVTFLTNTAMAQDWYAHRDERWRGEQWRAHMFAEVKEDLDHIQSKTFPIGRDEYRLVEAKHQLDELQNDLTAHRYEQSKLDEVIGTIQKVASDNRMSPRDRSILNDDLQHLRDYRAHHEHW